MQCLLNIQATAGRVKSVGATMLSDLKLHPRVPVPKTAYYGKKS